MVILFYILIWAAVSATLLVSTFLLYIAIMHLQKVRKQIMDGSLVVRWVCYFFVLLGLISNTALNWWFLTIAYYELPFGAWIKKGKLVFRMETLSTGRIVRHMYESDGLRQKQSIWWCAHWLSPFDFDHCKRPKK